MRVQIVRIHARLCGDGAISRYQSSEPDRNMRAEIVYTNYDKKNLKEFRSDMNDVFGVKMTKKQNELQVRSIRIADELEEKFGDLSSSEWSIPEEIFELERSKVMEWVRAFVRDEGYHEEKYDRLKIKSMNSDGLKQLKRLLLRAGYESNLNGPNCDGSWYLTVPMISHKEDLFKIAKNKPKVK